MNNHHDNGYRVNQSRGFLAGLLVGGLAGAGAMLLLAPQSGKETRARIQQESLELRDQMVKTVEDVATQAGNNVRRITDDVYEQAGKLEKQGQEVLDGQRDLLSNTLKGWGKAVQA